MRLCARLCECVRLTFNILLLFLSLFLVVVSSAIPGLDNYKHESEIRHHRPYDNTGLEVVSCLEHHCIEHKLNQQARFLDGLCYAACLPHLTLMSHVLSRDPLCTCSSSKS